jgi:MEDS: MEthanogen/methylotroph, DcmR Sensory domain
MEQTCRHQCLIYEGSPSRHLATIAGIMRQKLHENYRCLYLNSAPMVAGMRSYLAAAGVDVEYESARTSLVLSSRPEHLTDGHFDIDRMIQSLSDSIDRASIDGFEGLWATGDMTWEFGPDKDFSRLIEYEWRLEELFRLHPTFGGICQYHSDSLPREAVRKGLITHPHLFISETLTLLNPHYLEPRAFTHDLDENAALESVLTRLGVRDD